MFFFKYVWDFHKQDNKKKQTLKYLVDCTLNSKFNVQPVSGKSLKCLSLLRNPICWSYKNNRFPPLSKFPNWLMMDWFYLLDGFAVPTTVVSCGSLASLSQCLFISLTYLICDLFNKVSCFDWSAFVKPFCNCTLDLVLLYILYNKFINLLLIS